MRKLLRLAYRSFLKFARFILKMISKPFLGILLALTIFSEWLARHIPDEISPDSVAVKLPKPTQQLTEAERERERKRFVELTPDVAMSRFERFRVEDPFQTIPPALLNSADISDYVAETGMISPFYPDKLKPASYEIAFLGKCVYWDEKGIKRVRTIEPSEDFVLRRNSIAFVTLEPVFLIPDYIALRFNLKITHIYRGILLGTGPLVDPGFTGKMSVPLHNLTNNDYTLTGGEDLIWMEFTKLSPHKRWDKKRENQEGLYHPFPPNKSLRDVEAYLRKADPHRSIRSSIPEVARDATEKAQEAVSQARFVTGISLVAALAIVGTLLAYFNVTNSYLRQSETGLQKMNSRLEEMTNSNQLQRDVEDLKSRIKTLEEEKIKRLQGE